MREPRSDVSRDAQQLTSFNDYLGSPSYQKFVAMAVHDLAAEDPAFRKIKVPDGQGRFRLSVDSPVGFVQTDSGNRIDMAQPDVVASREQIGQIIAKANEYGSVDRSQDDTGHSKNLRQAIFDQWGAVPGGSHVVTRAADFEKALMSPGVVGQSRTVAELGQVLADNSKGGGLQADDPETNTRATQLLLSTAASAGFGHFFKMQGDPSDPTSLVTVVPKEKTGHFDTQNDDAGYEDRSNTGVPMAKSSLAKLRDNLGANEAAEVRGWMSLYESLPGIR